ncbi:MAG: AMP-binding protein, partial [Gemmatimonadetes bacterium]|nr:AMP-binding protein [Gemmatimonadota bacterium]
KGVLTPHRGVVNYLAFLADEYGIDARDTILQLATVSFDASIRDILGPLSSGARLVLVRAEETAEPARLLARVREHGVTGIMAIVPTLLRPLLDAAEAEGGAGASLRLLLLSGEPLPVADVRRAHGAFGAGLRVVNQWGATECTMSSTFHTVADDEAGTIAPVGRPIHNTRVYVLDPEGEPVPDGVPGEAYIATPGVARGYGGQPALSAEKFVPDPFSGEPGARMYRVGDRVRRLHDGALEFLGRMDGQVKVGGVRVELGEVEAALRAHPAVRTAAVVARGDAGATRLVAYLVAKPGEDPAPGALRAWLAERLPSYMVPAAWVRLDALPTLPNGKLDRRALPEPEGAGGDEAYVAPRTPTEEILAGIWAEVLGVERVGAEDDFFALGGHSLLATRMIARVRGAFGTELPLRTLFEAPTVAGIAERVEAALRAGEASEVPPIGRVPRTEGQPLPLSFAQQRLWFIDQMEPGSSAYNMPQPLRLRGALDVRALEGALTEIVRRHESLRTVFTSVAGEPAQTLLPPAPFALPGADLRTLPAQAREAEAARRVAEETTRPFDLEHGPLLRALLLRLDEGDWVLVFTMHHIVSDGWSLGVLTREVSALYGAYLRGEASPLPELPVQYPDYAVWQRAWLSGETLERHLEYWRGELADAPPVLELPTDHPRPPRMTTEGATHPFAVAAPTVRALRELSRREDATLFMTLLAAWDVLLARWAGQDDVLVGTPIAGRSQVELEALIGFFVNTLVLRTRLSGAPTFPELLGRVRESTLGAYQHQEVPFEKLVEELHPERSLQHSPFFQAMFILQNLERAELRLGALEMEVMGGGGEAVKFDLSLTLMETGDALHGVLAYRTALWEASTMARMAEQLGVLLEGIAADPARPVAELPLLPAAERDQVLVGWNRTGRDFTDEGGAHRLVEAQARRTPEAVALVAGELRLSYGELDREANRLAHHLRGLGVGVESRVGICLERSPELVVAELAILKAGGAFVPLDPAYPAERLAYMLADSGAQVLLTREGLTERIPEPGVPTVLLDRDRESIGAGPGGAPQGEVGPEATAYVIYTSGSTGRPKGVAVPHRGVPNLVRVMAAAHGLTPESRVLQFASPSFDAAVFETFFTLGTGAALYLPPAGGPLTGADLAEWVTTHGITHLTLSPSALAVIPDEAALPTLRTLMLAGEALPPALAARWSTRVPRLLNAYGPT